MAGGHVLGGGPAHESQRVSLKSKQVLKTYFYFRSQKHIHALRIQVIIRLVPYYS